MSEEILEETVEEFVDEEEEVWQDFGSEAEQKFLSFIESKKEYIEKFDAFRRGNAEARTGLQQATQDLIEEYHDILADLEDSKDIVTEMFSMGDLNKKMARHRKYPPEISAHHNRKALAWFMVLGGIVGTAGLMTIGGPNPAAWAPALKYVSLGAGSFVGLSVAVPTRLANWRKFDRDKVKKKKLNFLEKRIMTRVQEKERALSRVSLLMNERMLDILQGKMKISRERRVTKKKFLFWGEQRVLVTELLDDFAYLPKKEKKALLKLISQFSELSSKTQKLEAKLNSHKKETPVVEEERKEEQQKQTPKKKTKAQEQATIPQPKGISDAAVTPKPTPAPAPQLIISQEKETSSRRISINKEEMILEARDFFTKEELSLFEQLAKSYNSVKSGNLDSKTPMTYLSLLSKIEPKKEELKSLPNLNAFLTEYKKTFEILNEQQEGKEEVSNAEQSTPSHR